MKVKVALFAFFLALSLGSAQAHSHFRVGLYWGWWYPWGWGAWRVSPVVVEVRKSKVAVVDTDISPEHARVYLDGQLIGTADDFDGHPDYLYLEPGDYTLEFVLPGYQSHRVVVEARAGRFFPLNLELERKVEEKPAAWYDRPDDLPVARVFGKEGGQAAKPPGPDPSLRPDWQAEPQGKRSQPKWNPEERQGKAYLRVAVEPPSAAVYLDGEFLGTGEELRQLIRGLAVVPGEHELEVVAPGYEEQKKQLVLETGQELQVQVHLVPED